MGAVIAQESFGVSVSPTADTAQAAINTACKTDYITIPYGTTMTIAAKSAPVTADNILYAHRLCGRFFSTISEDENSLTVCSRKTPFKVGVNFDTNEAANDEADEMATIQEQSMFPGGIVGFKITYWQMPC